MNIYDIGKEMAELSHRVSRLEKILDRRLRLVNRTGLVAVLWIAAVLIAAYSSQAALATIEIALKLLRAGTR